MGYGRFEAGSASLELDGGIALRGHAGTLRLAVCRPDEPGNQQHDDDHENQRAQHHQDEAAERFSFPPPTPPLARFMILIRHAPMGKSPRHFRQ